MDESVSEFMRVFVMLLIYSGGGRTSVCTYLKCYIIRVEDYRVLFYFFGLILQI